MKWRFLTLALVAIFLSPLLKAAESFPYRNPDLPVEQRLADLLSRMTIEEKVAQLNLWPNLAELLKQTNVSRDIALTLAQASNGIGAMEYEAKLPPEDFARFVNAVQRFLVEQTRLGIPTIFDAEACHGFVGTNATVFPTPMALASTWDTALIERVYQAMVGISSEQYLTSSFEVLP